MTDANNPASRFAALDFLYGRIDYERSAGIAYSERTFKLDRMAELLARVGDPQRRLPIVHVAGTKGKGSTSAMIAAMLTAAGYRVGLFSSPHMFRIEERLAVDGVPCTSAELVDLVAQIQPHVRAMEAAVIGTSASATTVHAEPDWTVPAAPVASCIEGGPTFFEIITALGLVHFVRKQVDVAVLEVGLGGRLDSTNVCRPVVSVITSISYDHTRELGSTLPQIAAEKAGIIKPGVPVVSGVTEPAAQTVIRDKAELERSPLWELGRDFDFSYRPPRHVEQREVPGEIDLRGPGRQVLGGLRLRPVGRHQGANAAVAVAALARLKEAGFTAGESAIRQGLSLVDCPARVQVLARRPTVVVDAAHNVASAQALVDALDESFEARRRLLIFGTTRDKDVQGMLRLLLPRFDTVILTRYVSNPRGIPPQDLLEAAIMACPQRSSICQTRETPFDAWKAVWASAGAADLICVTGSFFLAADVHATIARLQSATDP